MEPQEDHEGDGSDLDPPGLFFGFLAIIWMVFLSMGLMIGMVLLTIWDMLLAGAEAANRLIDKISREG